MVGLWAPTSLAFASPLRLEYFSGLTAAGIFALLAMPVVLLGMRSLNGLGPVRKWVAIAARLGVLLLLVLILGGVRWQRQHKDLEVIVLRDISDSTSYVRDYPSSKSRTLNWALDEYVRSLGEQKDKPAEDRIGLIDFTDRALIQALPETHLALGANPIRDNGGGTDAAGAIQLALATLRDDTMHRLLLIWDGNQTTGDLEQAVAAAVAQHVPIDVMPLRYHVENAVLMDKFVAPTWKRENEPFTLDILLRSTNALPVTGKLTVLHQGRPLDLDPNTPGVQATRTITLQPGVNVEHVRVGPLEEPGVHQFHATFDADGVTAQVQQPDGGTSAGGARAQAAAGTRVISGSMDAFTFVRGKGKVLYVDNVADGQGEGLSAALAGEEINVQRVGVGEVPADIMTLQNYDAVILANVPRGPGGLSLEQDKMLASYVNDMGGGLVVIGGPDAFGAGGWQGSELEKVLPVDMDVPARKEMGKGALVMVMHSCEMPEGNYWGEQCAIKAVETLSAQDEIGVISYGWGAGGGGGGSQWDFRLQAKGDGSKVKAAIKAMQLGDMPSFNDSMDLALNGRNGTTGLKQSNAQQKHVIIISDGDPQQPAQALVNAYIANKVTVSTVTVHPHQPGQPAPNMIAIANALKGRAYGPIDANFAQLPQIFIKEATIVRRSLIYEDEKGIPLRLIAPDANVTAGLDALPPVYGMVLTTPKPSPHVRVAIVAGKNNDPLLAYWQTELGKSVAFTSDAHNKWLANWAGSPMYAKFWAQVVRSVSRPPMSNEFDIQTSLNGQRGKISVEAMDKEGGRLNFLSIRGQVVGPDMKAHDVRLVQTGPGIYTAEFDAPAPGNYVVVMRYTEGDPRSGGGRAGMLLSGVAMNSSLEMRPPDLRSNEGILKQIAQQTGGRELPPFDAAGADLYTRQGLTPSASPMPVWDYVLPVLMALLLMDVAVRRIAFDWGATKRYLTGRVQEFTQARKVDSGPTLDALKKVRQDVAEQKFKTGEEAAAEAPAGPRPDPTAKFEAKGVEGDISQVVGGATDKAVPPPPKKPQPKGMPPAPGGHTSSLLEAKRRAQQAIKQKEQE